MQFTPQQLAGYKGYSAGVLIGNWNEDFAVQTDKLKLYRSAVEASATSTSGQTSDFINVVSLSQQVSLYPAQSDGFVRLNVPVQIRSVSAEGAVLALDTTVRNRPRDNQALVTASTEKGVAARNTWILTRLAGDVNLPFYKANKEGDVLHFGQSIRISNEYGSGDGFYSLAASLQNQSKTSGFLESVAALGTGSDSIYVVEPAGALPGSLDGNPVKSNESIVLIHRASNGPLACTGARRSTAFGSEFELSVGIVKTAATKAQAKVASQPENFFTFVTGAAGGSYTPFVVPTSQNAIDRVRGKILERGGTEGFRAIVRTLQVMDKDKNLRLSRAEFKKGLDRYGVPLTTSELDSVFKVFDKDGDGGVSIAEFLRRIRGEMNARRTELVTIAFGKIDLDKSGVVTLNELASRYRIGTASSGAVAPADLDKAVRNFADSFGGSGGKITLAQFVEYYNDVSPSIDSDDYFELMIRNVWHIAGGQGTMENTSNRRVLVVFTDGSQKVVGIENDLGLDTNSLPAIRQRLEEQGVRDIKEIKLGMA